MFHATFSLRKHISICCDLQRFLSEVSSGAPGSADSSIRRAPWVAWPLLPVWCCLLPGHQVFMGAAPRPGDKQVEPPSHLACCASGHSTTHIHPGQSSTAGHPGAPSNTHLLLLSCCNSYITKVYIYVTWLGVSELSAQGEGSSSPPEWINHNVTLLDWESDFIPVDTVKTHKCWVDPWWAHYICQHLVEST